MRKSTMLAVALVSMLMLSALSAAAATADELTSESSPVVLTGTGDGAFVDQDNTTAGVVQCSTRKYTATTSTPTTSVTVTPAFSNCTTAGIPSKFEFNGCTYKLTVSGGASTLGDADLVCPAGSEVTITITPASGTIPCTLHVKGQSDIGGGVQLTNIGAGTTREITVNAQLTGIDYTHTAGSGLAKCTGGSAINGTMVAKAVFTGETHAGPHVGIFLSVI